jgi:hypothetical protein
LLLTSSAQITRHHLLGAFHVAVLRHFVLAGALLAAAGPVPGQARSLAPLGWLAGCWELRQGTRVTLEMWMPPAGELMLGASRTTGNGLVRALPEAGSGFAGGADRGRNPGHRLPDAAGGVRSAGWLTDQPWWLS